MKAFSVSRGLELDPSSFKTNYGLMLAFNRTGQALQQQRIIDKIQQLTPQDEEDCLLFSSLAQPQAEDYLRKVIEKNPNCGQAYKSLSYILFRHQKYREFVDCFRQLFRIEPNQDGNYRQLGCYAHRFDSQTVDYAKQVIEDVISKHPETPAVLVGVGRFFYGLQQEEEAVRWMQKVISIDKEFTPACSWLGIFQRIKGRIEKAVEYFKRVVRTDPLFEGINNLVCNSFAPNRLQNKQILTICSQVRRFYPQSLEVELIIAQILLNMRMHQKAEQFCQKVLQRSPRCVKAYQLLLRIEYITGIASNEKKIFLYRKILEIDPRSVALYSLGHCLIQSNNPEDGMDYLFKWTELNIYFCRSLCRQLQQAEDHLKYGDCLIRTLEFIKQLLKKYPGRKEAQECLERLTIKLDHYKNR